MQDLSVIRNGIEKDAGTRGPEVIEKLNATTSEKVVTIQLDSTRTATTATGSQVHNNSCY